MQSYKKYQLLQTSDRLNIEKIRLLAIASFTCATILVLKQNYFKNLKPWNDFSNAKAKLNFFYPKVNKVSSLLLFLRENTKTIKFN